MKRHLSFGLMMLATLFAASCAKELVEEPVLNGEAKVTFSVNTPEIATRAYSDGTTATVLQYAVYDKEGVELTALTKTDATINGSATVELQLTTGNTYSVIFWAAAPNAPYTVHFAEKTMTVDYTAPVCNDEARDAFYAYKEFTVKGAQTETIELRRPFAQLNIGTADYAASTSAGYTPTQSSVTVPVYTTLDLTNGDVDGQETKTFALANIKRDELFPVAGNEYLAMNYLLVAADKEVVDLTFTCTDGTTEKTRTVGSVPVQRNYRTNIYGNILTSEVDINVEIKPEYETPDNLVYVWDGTEVSEPNVSDDNDNIYEIEYASELAWLAAAVNGTLEVAPTTKSAVAPIDFAGKTFVLTQDVDLGGKEWTPIGNSNNIFKGTLDGQGKVVKNLKITGNNSNVGLFGVTHDGEIKNLVVENAEVSGRLNVGVVAGQPYTSKYTNITVRGHVEVNGMAYVGGVGGKNAYADWTKITVEADETSYVKANSVENGKAYRTYVGGVCGFNGEGGHTFKNITSNIDVEGSTCDVGGLFGIAHYGNQFVNCVCTGNVEIYAAEEAAEAQEIGGIAGVWHNETGYSVTMTECEFTGTLATNIEGVAFYYNGLVGKPYGNGAGKLTIDGKQYMATAAQLQAAINAAEGETTLYLGYDIVGDVTVVQKAGVKITIEGEGHKFNGSIKVHSNSEHYADAALTIKNVGFETSTTYPDKDGKPYFNFIEALENGSERYSTNITVEGCSFTATEEAYNVAVGLQIKSSKNAKVINCTATNMHSLIQAQSCDENVVVKGCTVNGKNGVAFKQVKAATVESTTITALEYGIRFDGNTDNYGIVVKNNNVTANQPLIVRKMTGKNNTITLEGSNTLATEAEYQIVITNGSDDAEYVKPTGTYTLTGADDYTVFPAPFPVASWDEFTAALAANEDYIKLTADIEYASNYQLQKNVILDLGGKSMTLPMINIHTKTTIKNGTINGKVYARKNAEIVFDNVKFSGAVADNLSTEGHLAIQGGCKSLYAKDCLFSPTSVSGSQTKPLSFEGGSTQMKFENCEFKSSPYKKQVYLNPLSATGSLDFTNCNFNNKTPNIMFAAACPLTNIKMSGTTKLSSVTFEINRAKDAVTDADLAYLRTLIANNSFSSVRVFYAGGSSEYIR